MPDPISWYALGRTIGDSTSIDENIDNKLLAHNLDPSAHSQSGEAIDNHREAPVLDHVAYSIYNIKTSPAARIYKAIVSGGLDGDFQSLQAAIDWANLYGGGIVYIKSGTYILESDITLYSNIELRGEDDDLTIIDCNNTANHIKCVGTIGTHKINIKINNIQVKNYLDGEAFKGAIEFEYVDDSLVEKCFFLNNYDAGYDTGIGINMLHCKRTHAFHNRFVTNGYPVYLDNCTYCQVNENYIENNRTGGAYIYQGSHNVMNMNTAYGNILNPFTIYGSVSNSVCNNLIANQTGEGIYVASASYNIICNNRFEGVSAVGYGIRLNSSDRNTISGNVINNFSTGGIGIDVGSDYNVVNGCVVTSTGVGIWIKNINCNKNIVTSNQLVGNTTAFSDSGTGTVSANNAS